MSNKVLVDDIVRDFDDDVVELTTTEDEFVCAGKDKKGHKRRILQPFGNILKPFVVRRVRC